MSDDYRTVPEMESRLSEIRGELDAIDAEHAGQTLAGSAKEVWEDLSGQAEDLRARIKDTNERKAQLEAFARDASKAEDAVPERGEYSGKTFSTRTGVATSDPYDLSQYQTGDPFADPQVRARKMRDGALRAIEQDRSLKSRGGQDAAAEKVEYFDDPTGTIARRILTTGSALYKRAFAKAISSGQLTGDEARALSLTGASGGFAVPYQLDPTVIPTSNGSVNPVRAISRVIPIPGDEWRGVSSAGVTAAYAAEATETSDNAPTIAQPTISTEKAQAFIPFSIEIGMDWGSLEAEMGRLLGDAKDDLEATAFLTGTGTNEPFGVLVGATTTVATTTTAAFVVADLYKLEEALGPRYRPRASFVANRFIFNKVRQFDTAGGASVYTDNLRQGLANTGAGGAGAVGPAVLGYPAYEWSAMVSALTTTNKIAVLGDFSRYVIVDRVGMQVEAIQHLVGTNHRPTGQRGLYAFWRNGAKVVDANGFRVLVT